MTIKLIDSLLILLLVLLPLALGTVHLWAISLFAIISLLLLNLCIFHLDFDFKKIFSVPIISVSTLFFVFILFQLVPLPAAILKLISFNTYKFYSEFSPSYPWVGSFRPISVYPWLTVFELIKVASCGMIFLVIIFRASLNGNSNLNDKEHNMLTYIQLGCLTGLLTIILHSFVDFNLHICANAFYFTVLLGLTIVLNNDKVVDKKFIFKITDTILITGFLIGLFGIIHKLSGSDKIYWLLKKEGEHFGPFINYDHFAGFMGMCASVAIAYFMARVRFSSFFRIKEKKDKLMWLSSNEASKDLRHLFYVIIMAGSLFYSSSRGGILSFIIAIMIFYFFIITKTKESRRGRLIIFAALIVLLSLIIAFWIGPDYTFDKFTELNKIARSIIHEPSILSERRLQMWHNTLNIIKDFPITGTGFGTFSSIFPKYRAYEWDSGFLRYAHSDYLQLISETGIFGLTLILMFFTYFLRLYRSNLKKFR